MQRTMKVVEIEDQNLYGSESNFDCISAGGNVRPFALHQVRAQILPDPGLISGDNTFRDNIGDHVCSEVNDQNLPGLNPTRNNINIASAEETNYQPMHANDQVFYPNRVGLDLKS